MAILAESHASLDAAASLVRSHRATSTSRGEMRLRAAAALVWHAHIASCQAIVLRRARRKKVEGGPGDVQVALKVASTNEEMAAAFGAGLAVQDCEAAFYRGSPIHIRLQVRMARHVLHSLAG